MRLKQLHVRLGLLAMRGLCQFNIMFYVLRQDKGNEIEFVFMREAKVMYPFPRGIDLSIIIICSVLVGGEGSLSHNL